jgi:gas vesicle protein
LSIRISPKGREQNIQSDHFSRSVDMKSFFAGLGIGIGLGILFAPMSGEETRNNLTQRASDLADSARDLVDQGRERVRSTVSAIRGQAERYTGGEATGTETGRNL